MLQELRQLAPEIRASVHPVFSNFGEPTLSVDQLADRDPHRWVICGGTALVERSLRSFCAIVNRIPQLITPRELVVLGGNENRAARALLANLQKLDGLEPSSSERLRTDYRPNISAADASQILCNCPFAWLDYFHRPDVPTDIILKSSVFAALCAHGVIPVFPHPGSPIEIEDDLLPGPFFVDPNRNNLPAANDIEKLPAELYHWYHRHAASDRLADEIANALSF